MLTKDCLPLLDLAKMQSPTTISSLRLALLKYGAFRLRAPKLEKAFAQGILHTVNLYFNCSKFKPTFSRPRAFSSFQRKQKTQPGNTQHLAQILFVARRQYLKKVYISFGKGQETRISPPSDLYLNIGALHDVRTHALYFP